MPLFCEALCLLQSPFWFIIALDASEFPECCLRHGHWRSRKMLSIPPGFRGDTRGEAKGSPCHAKTIPGHTLQGSSRTGIAIRTGSFLYLHVPHMPGLSSRGSHLCPRLTYEREGVFLAIPSQEVAAASREAVHALIKGVDEVTSKEAAAGHRRLAISPLCAKGP